MTAPITHREGIAAMIGKEIGDPKSKDPTTKNGLLNELLATDPASPRFAQLSQQLTEIRERLRKLEKVLEQENQFIMMRMKSSEANNGAVFR